MSRDVAQRLRRLLFIVPYVAKHPEGVSVEQLAKLIGAEQGELLADLDLLSQVGPPDGDPGEYLLVSVDEGRVFVDLAHRFERPLRLTPAEGVALVAAARALLAVPGADTSGPLASALAKLELELAGLELKQKAGAVGAGVGIGIGAALVGVYAVGFLFATIAATLALVVDTWLALLLVTVGLFVIAAILGLVAVTRIKRGTPPVPELAIQEAKLTSEALKSDGHHHA